MATIQQLPQELLQHILSYLPKQDVLVSRLTDRAFAEASRPASFRHINLCFFSWSLRRLQALSSSDNAKHVRSLTVFTNSVASIIRTEIEERVTTSSPVLVQQGNWEAAWSVNERYLADQDASLLLTLEWRNLLNDALSALPNLEVIKIQDLRHYDRRNCFPRVTVWHPALDSFSALQELVRLCHVENRMQMHLNVAAVLDAMGQRATKYGAIRTLRELHIRCSLTRPILSAECSPCYDSEERSRHHADLIHAVSAIKVMSLDLTSAIENMAEPRRAMSEQQVFPDMDILLSHMVELEKLELQTYQKYRWYNDDFPKASPHYSALLDRRPPIWPRLRHLQLSADVTSEAMISFMQTHTETLVSLDISGCRFDRPEAVLSGIPKALKLEHIEAISLGYLRSSGQNTWSGVVVLPRGVDENSDYETDAIRDWLFTGGGNEPEWPVEPDPWY